jgi:hypothetical protein
MKELDLKMINECGVVENPMLIKAWVNLSSETHLVYIPWRFWLHDFNITSKSQIPFTQLRIV